MPSVRIDDTSEIHYRVIGDGVPVLFVHGWAVNGHVFDRMLPLAGLRAIVPDHRGTGASTTAVEPVSIERLGRDMIAVADAAGLSTFALVGHSMGGQVAQWIASEIPDRVTSLVLLNAVPASGMQLPPDAHELFLTAGGDAGKLGTILDIACKELTPADREWLLEGGTLIAPGRLARMFQMWSGAAFADRLAAIKAPTLVVATDDPFLPHDFLREAIVERIAGARLHTLAGPGHYPIVERPAETGGVVRTFITGSAS